MSLDHAQGALTGVALGDAMGMPGELWPRARIKEHFGWIDHFLPGPDGHFVVDGFRAGQITDDTQQTLMLADAILEAGGDVPLEVVARHLVAWADRVGASEGNFLGPSSARAIQKLREGADPTTTGKGGETNGAAMRITPIGIVRAPGNPAEIVDAVVGATRMSHDTDIAVSGASLVAGVVSAGVEGATLGEALDFGYACAREGLTRGEKVVAASVVARAQVAIQIAQQSDDDDGFLQMLYDAVGASVAMSETVPAAVGLLVRGNAHPLRVAHLAANLGGDTDTIGAIATGMAGSLAGLDAIPADLVATLRDVNGIDPAAKADALYQLRR